jgi:hypothetical protein
MVFVVGGLLHVAKVLRSSAGRQCVCGCEVNAVVIDNAVSKQTPGGPGGPGEVLKSAHKSEGAPQRIDGTAERCRPTCRPHDVSVKTYRWLAKRHT